jgi:competence protein ComEA
MRDRRHSDRPDTRLSPPAVRAGALGPVARAKRAFCRHSALARSVHVRVWAPIALRALALAIALLGLAGIGSVVARAPALPPAQPAPGVSHAELGFGALSARALDVIASAVPPPSPAASADAATLPSETAPSETARNETALGAGDAGTRSAPCPERRDEAARAPAAEGAPVVLNRADAAELQRLPGVGAKRAEAILALRQRLGRFQRPSDLLRVKGIGRRTLERMLPHLVLD